MPPDMHDIRFQIEHSANAPNDLHDAAAAGNIDDSHGQTRAARLMPYLDGTNDIADLNRSSVEITLHGLDIGSDSLFQKLKQPRPFKRRTVGKMNEEPGFRFQRSGLPVEEA